VRFLKVEGAGNDYVLVDAFEQRVDDPAALSRAVADRHRGIGSDGLLLLLPPGDRRAAARMRIFNADGSEGRMCGNGLRCVVRYLLESGRAQGPELEIETLAGPRHGRRTASGSVEVHMGTPDFRPASLPVDLPGDGSQPARHELPEGLAGADGAYAVSVGNPHLVLRVADVEAVDLERVGRALQASPRLPESANVHVVQADSCGGLIVRPYERGSGATRACGTGAVAVAAVGRRLRWVQGAETRIAMPGGRLVVRWEPGGAAWLAGPARLVFEGDWRPGSENS